MYIYNKNEQLQITKVLLCLCGLYRIKGDKNNFHVERANFK